MVEHQNLAISQAGAHHYCSNTTSSNKGKSCIGMMDGAHMPLVQLHALQHAPQHQQKVAALQQGKARPQTLAVAAKCASKT
jgi:hypothetical protein